MPRKKTTDYDNTSITTLKGADRVRKRPAVIFGSDGIDGCQHSVFEILSNSIDEAREGYGKKSQLHAIPTVQLRLKITAEEFPLTTTKTKSATTGNWFSANYMPAASIITTRVKATNFPLV
jgi:Type IIA topoisomerase (DNA gyrase/topo II, topoisomerase IV), B subunit